MEYKSLIEKEFTTQNSFSLRIKISGKSGESCWNSIREDLLRQCTQWEKKLELVNSLLSTKLLKNKHNKNMLLK